MRKTSITLDENLLEFLNSAIDCYYEHTIANKDKNGFGDWAREETLFGVIDEKIYKALERCWKKPKNDIYEMTGGYLGDGVYITEDGRLYEN
jgi:hypothetical protein